MINRAMILKSLRYNRCHPYSLRGGRKHNEGWQKTAVVDAPCHPSAEIATPFATPKRVGVAVIYSSKCHTCHTCHPFWTKPRKNSVKAKEKPENGRLYMCCTGLVKIGWQGWQAWQRSIEVIL
jgi:hypothetical protein